MKPITTRASSLLPLLALTLIACGSTSSGGSAAPASVPIEQVAAKAAQAECDAAVRCLGPLATVTYPSNECVQKSTDRIAEGELGSAIKLAGSGGTLTYDGTQIDACLAAVIGSGCPLPVNANPPACQAAFGGKTAIGGACTVDEECGAGYCNGGGTCPGVCAARGSVGAACVHTSACGAGLVCALAICVTPASDGQACGGTSPPCGGGLLCVGADAASMKPGTCKLASEITTVALGQPCDFVNGTACQAGLFCAVQSFAAGKTVSQCVAASAAGGACKVAFPDACPTGQYCNADLASGKIDGTCAPLPKDGEACDTLFGRCGPTSVCDAMKVCRPLQHVGSACTEDRLCYSNSCVSGACALARSCSQL